MVDSIRDHVVIDHTCTYRNITSDGHFASPFEKLDIRIPMFGCILLSALYTITGSRIYDLGNWLMVVKLLIMPFGECCVPGVHDVDGVCL